MIDVVYILGTGSKWHDNELRYSLRSIEKYVTGVRNIYIVGHKPDWVLTGDRLKHIPVADKNPGNLVYKERNIMLKLLEACRQVSITKEFLFMNDDHYFLDDADAVEYPHYYHENIATAIRARNIKDQYNASMENTQRVLAANKLYTLFYDVHHPMRINKEKFMRIMDAYDWNVPYGYVIKSLYANTAGIEGESLAHDCKLYGFLDCAGIQKEVSNLSLFSTGNSMEWSELEAFMEFTYPDKSVFENTL